MEIFVGNEVGNRIGGSGSCNGKTKHLLKSKNITRQIQFEGFLKTAGTFSEDNQGHWKVLSFSHDFLQKMLFQLFHVKH